MSLPSPREKEATAQATVKLHLSLHFQLVQLICVCAMCVGFAFMKGLNNVSECVYFGEPTSTLWYVFAYFSRVFKVDIFQLRHSPFLLGLFWGLPRSHRLSSHSRLNAFEIQTKLNRQEYREVKLHVILVGAMGIIYKDYTDKPLADHNLDYHKIKNLHTNWTNTPSDMHLHS